ncbi:hypothetical protein [Nitratireductor thuwali]|uniref:Uncharacterized protein n=1 Tax=Nitratireductor thuwali TaxID=2267699 RepID=A0ABY5MG05_9HYPH|nr:hypothetical protein NTH_00125 [Nitratireductor thuwali]
MDTHRNIEKLSNRDQRWLGLGLAFGALLKQIFDNKDTRGGANVQPDACHQL